MKKNIYFIFLFVILSFAVLVYAAQYYQVNSTASVTVDEWGTCKIVTNNNAQAIFVPTATSAEWTAFRTYAPGVTLLDCLCSGGAGTDDANCGTIDCDGLNYYYKSGGDSPSGTNYCYYRDYADITTDRCKGVGDCKDANSADCTSYANNLQATAGLCKYISGCSGSTPGTVYNYVTGTSCGTTSMCSSGSCVSSSMCGYTITGSGLSTISDSGATAGFELSGNNIRYYHSSYGYGTWIPLTTCNSVLYNSHPSGGSTHIETYNGHVRMAWEKSGYTSDIGSYISLRGGSTISSVTSSWTGSSYHIEIDHTNKRLRYVATLFDGCCVWYDVYGVWISFSIS